MPKIDKWCYFFIQLLLKARFWLPIQQFDLWPSCIGETNWIIDNLNVVGPWYKCRSNRWKLNLHITHSSPHGQAPRHNFPMVCLAQTLKLFGHFLSDALLWGALPPRICALNLFQILLDLLTLFIWFTTGVRTINHCSANSNLTFHK